MCVLSNGDNLLISTGSMIKTSNERYIPISRADCSKEGGEASLVLNTRKCSGILELDQLQLNSLGARQRN